MSVTKKKKKEEEKRKASVRKIWEISNRTCYFSLNLSVYVSIILFLKKKKNEREKIRSQVTNNKINSWITLLDTTQSTANAAESKTIYNNIYLSPNKNRQRYYIFREYPPPLPPPPPPFFWGGGGGGAEKGKKEAKKKREREILWIQRIRKHLKNHRRLSVKNHHKDLSIEINQLVSQTAFVWLKSI